uniref:RING-type E3 ubiquitin transferase n=1 Tax=Callorhinchus milii TaxID=7868 RepID=A0A4W3K930_CALMI
KNIQQPICTRCLTNIHAVHDQFYLGVCVYNLEYKYIPKIFSKCFLCFSSTVISSKERLLTSVIPENKEKENKRPIYEQLICPVCRKLFVHPQMLPCKHSFCEHCIPKKTTTKPINKHHIVVKCPVCEAETYFTSIEKVRFPDNILLVKVLSRLEEDKHGSNLTRGYRKEIYCDACDKKFKKVAVKKCISHNLNVCIDCLQKHGRSNKPGQGVVEPSINYNETKCFDHPDSNLVMYCITDKIPICEDCIFGQHKDHLIISLEEAFHNDSFDLHDAIAKYLKDQSENEMLSLNILKSKFQGDKALLDKEITKEFTVLHGTLQQKEKEIKDLLQKEINVREQMINDFADAKSRAIFSLDSLAEFAKEALRETNESVFLQMSCVLVEQLTEKINQILFSGKELNQSPFHGFEMNVKTISTQIEEVFEPILKSVTILKDQKVSPADKASVVNEKVVSSLYQTNRHTYKHIYIHGTLQTLRNVRFIIALQIFWMVPENDTVDSFDAQIQEIQEISSSKSKSTRQIKPSIFTGIRASSFETSSLKPNSEYLFRVRAANIAGQSDWSYPYKVSTDLFSNLSNTAGKVLGAVYNNNKSYLI